MPRVQYQSDVAKCDQLTFFTKLQRNAHLRERRSADWPAERKSSTPFDVFAVMNLFQKAPTGQAPGMEKEGKPENPDTVVFDEDYLISMLGMCMSACRQGRIN